MGRLLDLSRSSNFFESSDSITEKFQPQSDFLDRRVLKKRNRASRASARTDFMNHFNLFPFVLSLSKDSEEVFQQPVFRDSSTCAKGITLVEISSLSGSQV